MSFLATHLLKGKAGNLNSLSSTVCGRTAQLNMKNAQQVLAIFVICLLAAQVEGRAAPRRTTPSRARVDKHVAQALQQHDSRAQRVIIRARPGSESAVSQALRAHGDRVYARHASIGAFTAEIHGKDLAPLVESDLIESISIDARVNADGQLLGGLIGVVVDVVSQVLDPGEIDTSQPPVSPKVLRATLGLSTTSWTGRGIGVAVIDSGIAPTLDFQSRIAAFYDFTNGGMVAKTSFDDYGHGTHVAGTIGGSGALSSNNNYRGLAPKVRFIGLKVLDAQGQGWTSDVLRAIDFAVQNKTALGIDIINLSLGHPIFEPAASDPLVQAVERAVRAGIVVVAAAGNYGKNPETGLPGYAGITSPGNAPSAITVGAVNVFNSVGRADDRIATYSSRGPTWYDGRVKPDIVAPGHDLVAAASRNSWLYKNYPQLRADDADYMRLSGTSMATAVTSGVVALMLEANRYTNSYPARPSLTPNAVKAALEYTALNIHDDHGLEYDLLTKGTGSLNGRGAIDVARAIDTSQPQGAPWVIRSLAPADPWTTIDGANLPWSQALIWGNTVIWGSTMQLNHPAWSTTVIWGSNETVIWGSNDTVIWGSNDTVIWGSNDTVIWGSNDTVIWGSNDTVIWGSNDTVIWGSHDVVWQNPSTWSTAVVWGPDSLGRLQGGTVIWGSTNGLTQDTVIWGSLEEEVKSTAASQSTLVLPK
jgi:serine protease AprX